MVERALSSRWRRWRWWIIGAAVAAGVAAAWLADVDTAQAASSVAQDIRQIPPSYVALACALKTLESLLTALSWRNILRAAFPERPVSYRFVFGAYQGGVGINSIAPASAGTFMTFGLFRLRIPGASTPAVLSAAVVQNALYALLIGATWVLLFVTHPSATDAVTGAADRVGAVAGQNTLLAIVAAVAGVAIVIALACWLWKCVADWRRQAWQGGAILREPRRYALTVALPQLLSYACRWGVTATLLAAFGIAVTPRSVLLVIAANSLANLTQIAPGGIGTTQALLALALRDFASASDAAAYSLAESSILAVWNIALGAFALVLAFGVSGALAVFGRRDRIVAEARLEESSA